MKRKQLKTSKMNRAAIAATLCILSCTGCSPMPQEIDAPSETAAAHLVADITIPSVYVGSEVAQVQSCDIAADNGDGTVTYSLKGAEIDSILEQISANISDSIQKILDDDDYYPDITSITPAEDYTSFTISLSDGRMNTYESMLVMSFYTIGNRYQIYNGIPAEQAVTTVIYVNDADGSVISKTDSTSVELSPARD